MNIQPSTNLKDLNTVLVTVRSAAVISDEELITAIEGVIANLHRVGTCRSKAVLGMIKSALGHAFGKAERNAELKAIAVWATNIQISWL